MIEELIKQTQSPGQHTKLFGCYEHCLVTMAQDQIGKLLTVFENRDLVLSAITAGIILDNNFDYSVKGWYRCFVKDPVAMIQLAAMYLNKKPLSICNQIAKINIEKGDKFVPKQFLANYVIIENITDRYDDETNEIIRGSHFTLGEIDQKTGLYKEAYNPWPGLKTNGIRTLRLWEVKI